MSDLIEKVSRAIAPHWWAGVDAADESERNWLMTVQAHVSNLSRAKEVILAVLDAIREPTEEMLLGDKLSRLTLAHAGTYSSDIPWDQGWRAMVDAKRKEIEEE